MAVFDSISSTKPPIAIYYSTIAVCLNAPCSCSVWRKSLISDRRSLIDWSPAGCLHPSPSQPPPPASQLIDCYKVFAPSRSLSRPLLSETVFDFFLSYINIQIYLFIFFLPSTNNIQLRRWWYITNWYLMYLVILDLEIHFPVQMTLAMIRNLS